MILYITFIFILLLLCLFFRKNKKKLCISVGTFLFLIVLLKIPTLGNSDTVSLYIPNFYQVQSMSFLKVINNYKYTEFVFYLYTKLFTMFSSNLNIYFALCALPFIYVTSQVIYKYSNKPVLSYIILYTVYYPWIFIIVRHSMAWAFLIVAVDKYLSKHYTQCLINIILASLFHRTALIFLLIFIIAKLKNKYFQISSIIISFILCYFFKSDIKNIIFFFINSGHYKLYEQTNSELNLLRYLVFLIIYIFMLFFTKKKLYSDRNYNIYFNLYWMGCVFLSFGFILWDFFRISMYFNVFSIIILPDIVADMKIKNQRLLVTILILIFAIYGLNVYNLLHLLPFDFVFLIK